MFFVASAPLSPSGHVNLSPKGLDTFRLLGPNRAAYLDLTGSGAETVSHLQENGRITLMFCAFTGNPDIVRLYGTGTVLRPGSDAFDALAASFSDHPGRRSIIDIEIHKVGSSCGFGVPKMDFVEDRDRLGKWARARGEEAMPAYWATKNRVSIDGLPAMTD